MRDSAINRFELAFDLSWKTVKVYLTTEGIQCASPKGCFREAFTNGILIYDEFRLEMVDIRNEATHSYDESNADKIYKILLVTLEHFRILLDNLKAKSL